MKPLYILLCLSFMSPAFGEGLLTSTKNINKPLSSLGYLSPIVFASMELLPENNSTVVEGSTVSLLKGAKVFAVLSYVGLGALIVTLSLKRRKMIKHFQTLKQEHLALCEEVEEKIAMCSTLSSQANQKARELTSCTLSVIQKHNVVALVNNELKALSPLFNETPLNETVAGKRFKSIIEIATLDNRNYWNDFLSHFQLLYPNYLSNIKQSGHEITEKELKLAALLRLGLDTKKIAGLLNLSPVSIKVFRHRLRKKLELPEDVNLYNYLSHFDNLNQ